MHKGYSIARKRFRSIHSTFTIYHRENIIVNTNLATTKYATAKYATAKYATAKYVTAKYVTAK